MNFAWPYSFLLALPMAFAAYRMLRRGRRAGIRFAPVFRLPAKTAGWRAKAANLAPWIFLAGAALLVTAAARPRKMLGENRRSVDAIAIAMATLGDDYDATVFEKLTEADVTAAVYVMVSAGPEAIALPVSFATSLSQLFATTCGDG